MSHYSDRSRYESGQRCPRQRYWGYHHDGLGVSRVGGSEDLLFGQAIHWNLEYQLSGKEPLGNPLHELLELVSPVQLPDGGSQFDETSALYNGLCSSFREWMLPQLRAEYEWLGSEQEHTMDLGSVCWMSRLDAVLRRRSDGLYFVLEAKTTSYPEDLQKQSLYNFQLLMELESLRRSYNLEPEQIGGALLLVFNKGQKRKVSEAEQRRGLEGQRRLSPFTYCYRKDHANGETEFALDYKAGWDRCPTWTVPGWLDILRETWPERMREQVQLWPSVSFDQERTKQLIGQIQMVEDRAAIASSVNDENWVNFQWPQNFSNCLNDGGFRRPCPFLDCCFSPAIGADPVGSGDYEPRRVNHPQELER